RRARVLIERDCEREVCVARLHYQLPHDESRYRRDFECGACDRETVMPRMKPEIKTYDKELMVATDLARTAGSAILAEYKGPLRVEQKNYDDDIEPVTQADRIANELIVNGLKQKFPSDGILAEESVDTERRLSKSRVWMVDPLDGTNGFIDGNGDFA